MDPADVKKVPFADDSIAARVVDEGFADYADAYEIAIDPRRFPDADAFARAFVAAPPPWVAGLLRARDAMVSWIGLKTTNGGTVAFQERERADREIVFGEDAICARELPGSHFYRRSWDELRPFKPAVAKWPLGYGEIEQGECWNCSGWTSDSGDYRSSPSVQGCADGYRTVAALVPQPLTTPTKGGMANLRSRRLAADLLRPVARFSNQSSASSRFTAAPLGSRIPSRCAFTSAPTRSARLVK